MTGVREAADTVREAKRLLAYMNDHRHNQSDRLEARDDFVDLAPALVAVAERAETLKIEVDILQRCTETSEGWVAAEAKADRFAEELDEYREGRSPTAKALNRAVNALRVKNAALETIRAELDLPDHLAEIVGDALAKDVGRAALADTGKEGTE